MNKTARILIFSFFAATSSFAQNLIPNPGFEDHSNGKATHWRQPAPPRFHLECYYKTSFDPHSGNCHNGLCFHSADLTEFFHVKLSEPLIKGEKYLVHMYVKKRSGNSADLNAIGFWFSKDDRYAETLYGYISAEPNMKFYFNPRKSILDWTLFKQEYIAEGNEQYLNIGHLQSESVRSEKRLKQTEEEKIRAKLQERMAYEAPKKIKNSKKQKEQDEKFRQNIRSLQNTAAISTVTDAIVRLYFDDFCIAKIDDNGVSSCELPLVVEAEPENTFSVGKTISLDVKFETAKSELIDSSLDQLYELIEFLDRNPDLNLEIAGHTDNKGEENFNQKLSEDRAASVANFLIEAGIAKDRITYSGFGSKMPLHSNDTEQGRAFNRRVEAVIR
jgi:outer membrane protein OmpA-like peptidoglycan-associated protein